MKVIDYKGHKIIVNKIIPFRPAICWNLFGFIFLRDENEDCLSYKNHYYRRRIDILFNYMAIHTEQMRDWFGWINKKWRNSIINTILGGIIFYAWYLIEWTIRLFLSPIIPLMPISVSFEQEAIINENNFCYRNSRKPFNWLSRIFKP